MTTIYALIDFEEVESLYASSSEMSCYKFFCLHYLIPWMKENDDYSLMKEHKVESFDDLWNEDNWDWLWDQTTGMMKMVVEITVTDPITDISET